MVFHWSLSDKKSRKVPRTLLSIQADLNNAVVWMISARPLCFEFFTPALADGLLRESEGQFVKQQISSILCDSLKYSNRFQACCGPDCRISRADLQLSLSFVQGFRDSFKGTNYE